MARMDFSITHLRYFYDAAISGSVVRSAQKNFVTHSAVSQGIKKLEESLDVNLVAHKKRHFHLTGEGKNLLKACEKIFESLEQLKDQVQLSQDEPVGELLFGSS